jgi:hypothetical protein
LDLRINITPINEPTPVTLARDHRIEVAFLDSTTGAVIEDCTGADAVLVSQLLTTLPPDALAQFVNETAARMVAIAKGIDNG